MEYSATDIGKADVEEATAVTKKFKAEQVFKEESECGGHPKLRDSPPS